MSGKIDEWRKAGFSEEEINAYIAEKTKEWQSAGFSPNDINAYLNPPKTDVNAPDWDPHGGETQIKPPDNMALLDTMIQAGGIPRPRIMTPPPLHPGLAAGTTRTAPIYAKAFKPPELQASFDAMEKLKEQGFDDDQIRVAMQARQIERPNAWGAFKENLGQTIGGTIGGLQAPAAAGILGQVPPFNALPEELLTIPVAGALASIYGGAGKAAQAGLEGKEVNLWDLVTAGGQEAAFEVGGRLATKGLKTLGYAIIKKPVPKAKELIEDFRKVAGGRLLASETDKRWTIGGAEALAKGSWGGQQIFDAMYDRRHSDILKYADTIVDSIAREGTETSATRAGELLLEAIERPGIRKFGQSGWMVKQLDDMFGSLYKGIDALSQGATCSTKSLKSLATAELLKNDKAGGLLLSGPGRKALTRIMDLDDVVSFSTMKDMRSAWLADVLKMSKDLDKSEALVKRLAGTADTIMFSEQATKGLSSETKHLLRNTNALYHASREVMTHEFPHKLAAQLAQRPEKAVGIFQPGAIEKTLRLKQALTEGVAGMPSGARGRDVWEKLTQAWLADAIDKSTKEGVLKAGALSGKLNRMGEPMLRAMYGPKYKEIENLIGLLEITSQKGSFGGSLVAKSMQIGGIGLVGYSMKEGDWVGVGHGGALALGPVAFAKLATRAPGLLRAGLTVKPGSSMVGPLIVRISKALMDMQRAESMTERFGPDIPQPSHEEFKGFGGRGW